jgi:hypothetical protein
MVLRARIGDVKNLPASDMQERKNKQRLIVLVVLVTITVAVFWFGTRDNTGPVDKSIFRTQDLKGVDKIVLGSGDSAIVLTYAGSRWKVNDRWNADRNMIEVLFATLQQAEPKRPVSAALTDSLGSALEKQGVKVTLFSKDVPVQEFFAGGNAQKTKAYFRKASDNQVYVMTIPGYRVYVSGIFELPESGWRDKYIFGFNWQNFQALEAGYPKNPAQNFSIRMQDHYFGIPGLQDVDTTRLNDFLDAVSLLTADDYIKATASLDSLAKTNPLQALTIKDIGNREYSLKLYPFGDNQLFGLINQSEWAVIDPQKVRNILRPKDFFARH